MSVAHFQAELRALTPRVFVTWLLFAANIALFVVMVVKGVDAKDPTIAALITWGADYAPKTLNGEPWRLLTATFIHIGFLHLGMNMLVLASIGPFVERIFGNLGFVVLYVAAGLAGSVTSIVWSPDIVSAGASGAIFGLYGGLMGFALRNKQSIPRAAFIQLVQRAGTFVVINVVYAFSQKGIDMAAHAGGLFGGFLAGLALARPLTPAGISKRGMLAALVAAATAALVAISVVALPKPADLEAAFAHQEQVRVQVNASLAKLRETEDVAVVVKVLEEEVLPPWEAEIASLEKLQPSGKAKDDLERLLADMRKQRGIWKDALKTLHE